GRVSSAPPFSSFKTNSLQSLHLLCVCWRYPELLSSSFVWSCSDEQTDVGASICRLETASHDSPVVGLVKRYQGVLRCSYTYELRDRNAGMQLPAQRFPPIMIR